MIDISNFHWANHVLEGAGVLSDVRLADETQPPNVRKIWMELRAALGAALMITQADLRRLERGQENVPQQEDRTARQEMPQHRPSVMPEPMPK